MAIFRYRERKIEKNLAPRSHIRESILSDDVDSSTFNSPDYNGFEGVLFSNDHWRDR